MEGIDKEQYYKLECKQKKLTRGTQPHTQLYVSRSTFGSLIAIAYENPRHCSSKNSPLVSINAVMVS